MRLDYLYTQLFTSSTWTAKDIPDMTGKVCVVTGGSTGVGKVTCLELARKGAHVFCLGRTKEKTMITINEIRRETGNEKVEFLFADLMDFKSVEKAADEFLARKLPLHVLVNNAGIMAVPYEESRDGIESQFATNHFSHVILTMKLLPVLISTNPSRIVILSSTGHEFVNAVEFDRLNDRESYNPWNRYGETKLANLLFAKYLQKKLTEKNIFHVRVNAVHPGLVKTELGRSLNFHWILMEIVKFLSIDTARGAITQLYVATSPDIEKNNHKGQYFVPYAALTEPTDAAKDTSLGQSLMEWTEKILKERFKADWTIEF